MLTYLDADLPVPHLASYTRISLDRLGLLAGVGRQRGDNATLAGERWPELPVVLYEDNDRSAYSGRKRPAYLALVAGIKNGHVDAAVAWDQDRLIRLPRELEALIDLCEAKKFHKLATASGEIDLTTYDGQFKARIMAAVAKKSSDDTSRRVKRMIEARKAEGLPWGRLPYGVAAWEDGALVPDPHRYMIIETMRDRLLAGDAFASILRWAREQDPDGHLTRPGYQHALLTSPLLSPQDRADMRAIFRDPERRTAFSNERASWLAGLLVCDVCDAKLRRDVTGDRGRGQWKCPAYHVGIQLTRTETAVRDMLLAVARVRKPVTAALPAPVEPAPEAQERLARLARLYVAGSLTDAEWEAARAAIAPPPEPPPAIAPSIERAETEWRDWTVTQKHRFAADLLREVRVQRAHKMGRGSQVTDRLDPKWRQ